MPTLPKRPEGFVLLDVLIASVVLSAGCLLLVQSMRESLFLTRRAQDLYEVSLTANNMLWMLDRQQDKNALSAVISPGSIDHLQWSLKAQDLDNPNLQDKLEAKVLDYEWPAVWAAHASFEATGYYPHDIETKLSS